MSAPSGRTGGIIAVVAHPDDEALIAGGTLALAADAGLATGVVSLTRGELGPISDPRLADERTLGMVRAGELRASGRALGIDWTHCLRHPDGELEWADAEAGAAELAALLRASGPAVLLTFGADGVYGHRDHVATRVIAGRAAELLGPGGPLIYEAVWAPSLAGELVAAARGRGLPDSLWGLEPEAFGSPAGAVGCSSKLTRLDVRAVIERKLAALRAHRTQLDDDHLLLRLPLDLAARHLGEEAWRQADPHSRDVLAELLAAHLTAVAHG